MQKRKRAIRINQPVTSPAAPVKKPPPIDRKQAIYDRLRDARNRFGLIRLEMGILLDQIHKEKIWEGRAATFGAFLEEERINTSSAYDFMRVARKFFFELQLSDEEFNSIASVNMGILSLASQVITKDNKDEVIGYITVLSERDAKQVLLELIDETCAVTKPDKPKRSQQVNKALRVFRDLPDDQRIEFFHSLRK